MADCVNDLRNELKCDAPPKSKGDSTRTWAIVIVVCIAIGAVAHIRMQKVNESRRRYEDDPLFQPF